MPCPETLRLLRLALLVLLSLAYAARAEQSAPAAADSSQEIFSGSAIALQGEPRYSEGFTHFDYVNPDAPYGGTMSRYAAGTFDSLHRFGKRGASAAEAEMLYDTLLVKSQDEIEVYYPLVAERVTYPADYSWVTFHIDPRARFQDGKPIRAEDIRFSFEEFKNEGVSQFKSYFSFVQNIEVLDPHRVRFELKDAGRDQMLSLFLLRVLPEHYWSTRDFGEPLREAPIGSSGRRVHRFSFGQYITYENMENYWARNLPSRKGHNNIQYIRYDYYQDANVGFTGFKSGAFDFWEESQAKNWATAYDFPAIRDGRIRREEIPHSIPQDTGALVYNTKRKAFKDYRVRWALAHMLDFEWMNRALFYNQYQRTRSLFTNTPYMAEGLPEGLELETLERLRGQIPEEVFTQAYAPPSTDGSGYSRKHMRRAVELLEQAGWSLRQGRMVHAESGQPFSFELLYYSPVSEKVALAFKARLARIGIEMNLRRVDTSQFINRLRSHDFDMTTSRYLAMAYPSSDLKIIWRSDFIDSTWNTANVTDPAVDELVNLISGAQQDPERLLAYGKAFDRVIMWNHYFIPQWHLSAFRIAYKDKFARPAQMPRYDLGLDTWWVIPQNHAGESR